METIIMIISIFLNLIFIFFMLQQHFIYKEKIEWLKLYNSFTQRVCNVMNENKIKQQIDKAVKKSIWRHFKNKN